MRQVTLQRIEALRECAASGLTQSAAARNLGLYPSAVSMLKARAGIAFTSNGRGVGRKTNDDRADEMARRYRAGETLQQIGTSYGITRERVRQLIKKYHGLRAKDGGQNFHSERKKVARQVARDRQCLKIHGCTHAEWRQIKLAGDAMRAAGAGYYRTPLGAFKSQRQNARLRGIEWKMTLWQWWNIWQSSGVWEQRGSGQGYCMCRKDDVGPYSVENIYIATGVENSSAGQKNRHHSGLPKGVQAYAGRFVARRQVAGHVRRLGIFETPEEAHAAYLASKHADALQAAA